MTGSRTMNERSKRRKRKRAQRKALFAWGGLVLAVCAFGLLWYGLGLNSASRTEAPAQGGASPAASAEGDTAEGTSASTLGPEPVVAAMSSGASDDDDPARPAASSQAAADQEGDLPSGDPPSGEPPDTADGLSAGIAVSGKPDKRVRMAFVGDVMLGSNVDKILRQQGYDYPYKSLKSQLSKADLTIANFESPITERGTPQAKEYVYRTSPQALPAFKDAGFDVVNLANNHVLDYGEIGLLDTLDALDRAGIARIGAGRDADEAYKPVYMETNGLRIAFLGFSRVVPKVSWKAGKKHPGVAESYDETRPLEAIRAARADADLVVVVAHWGEERSDKPNDTQVTLAHHYIDAGADLVIGGHPHVLQGMERYKGKWIAYSLGNFIFTTNNVPATLETMILEASCSKGDGCDLQVTPVFSEYAKPERMSPDRAAALLARLSGISINAKVGTDGAVASDPLKKFR